MEERLGEITNTSCAVECQNRRRKGEQDLHFYGNYWSSSAAGKTWGEC